MQKLSPPDFHVVSLHYSLVPSSGCTFLNSPPKEFETEAARFRLADGQLTCEMKKHYSTVEAARAVIDPVLRAWEVDSDLRWSKGDLRFEFKNPVIVDRSPVPPGVIRGFAMTVQPRGLVSGFGNVSVHVTRGEYPDPPNLFRLNEDAQTILDRYYRYIDQREPLLAMAYFCLTFIEGKVKKSSGRRKTAADLFKIEYAVLNTIGELTSERGDSMSARKASPRSPLTLSEGIWLETAIKKLVWQLGTPAHARSWIRMSDLPTV